MQFSTSMRSTPDPNPDSLGWLLPHLLSTRQIIEGRRINLLEQTPEYLGGRGIQQPPQTYAQWSLGGFSVLLEQFKYRIFVQISYSRLLSSSNLRLVESTQQHPRRLSGSRKRGKSIREMFSFATAAHTCATGSRANLTQIHQCAHVAFYSFQTGNIQ
jgi:hypothetical protein